MNLDKAVNELYFFSSEPRVFKFDELSSLVDANIDPKALRKTLLGKSRFICLSSDSPDDDYFLLDSTLFHWLSQLNLKLAKLKKFRLTEHQITNSINLLRREGEWDSLPKEIIRWGQSIGLICLSYTKSEVVFPLAQIMSYMTPRNLDAIIQILREFFESQIWHLSLKKYLKELLKKGFSKFSDKIGYIIHGREALHRGNKVTLQELGEHFCMSRERVRQLEEKFWESINLWNSFRKPFIEAFLCDFMNNSGSLIIDTNSSKAPLRRFLAKCVGIPTLEFSAIGLVAFARLSRDMVTLKSKKSLNDSINAEVIANNIESKKNVILSRNDIQKFAKKIEKNRIKNLNSYQRTYLSLYKIGRPAHYSEVTEVHNSLWPNCSLNERSVHHALTKKKLGIVWIGIKGTYALREWGYERPTMTLFESVSEIVKRKHEETRAPVSIPVIIAELGKYRRIVNPTSLTIVIFSNTNIRRVSKDSFIPREHDDKAQEEISLDELDNIFKKFEKKFNK